MELTQLFDPANALSLTEADLEKMASLTDDEIKTLATAFPNKSNQQAYLILKDTKLPASKQLFPLSTWPNLWNLRKIGMKNFVATSFKQIFNKAVTKMKIAAVQDLTVNDVKKAPGLKDQRPAPRKPVVKQIPISKTQKAKPVEEFPDLKGEAEKATTKKRGGGKKKAE